jgi:hypothetical protein
VVVRNWVRMVDVRNRVRMVGVRNRVRMVGVRNRVTMVKIRKIALKTNLSLRRHFLQHPPVEGAIRIPAGNNRVLPDV